MAARLHTHRKALLRNGGALLVLAGLVAAILVVRHRRQHDGEKQYLVLHTTILQAKQSVTDEIEFAGSIPHVIDDTTISCPWKAVGSDRVEHEFMMRFVVTKGHDATLVAVSNDWDDQHAAAVNAGWVNVIRIRADSWKGGGGIP